MNYNDAVAAIWIDKENQNTIKNWSEGINWCAAEVDFYEDELDR